MDAAVDERRFRDLRHGLMNLRGFYLLSGLVAGFLGPYTVSWFVADGMSTDQAGMIIAVATAVALIFQPILGMTVDRYGIGKLILLLSVLVLGVLSVFFNARSFWVLLVVFSLATIFKNIQAPITDTYAISISRNLNVSYGAIRSFASFGIAFGGLLGGQFVSHFTVQKLWIAIMGFSVLGLLAVLGLPDVRHKGVSSAPFLKDMTLILKNRKFLVFLFGCLLVNQTLPAFDSYFVVTFEAIGGSFSMAGFGLLLGSLANIPAMLIASRVIKRIGLEGMLLFAAAVYVLRWCLQMVIADPLIMVLFQSLHGLSFGFFYVAAVQYVAVISEERMLATAQSVFNMVFVGLCGIVGNLFNGYLFSLGGPTFMYAFCAASALLGTICLYINAKKMPTS